MRRPPFPRPFSLGQPMGLGRSRSPYPCMPEYAALDAMGQEKKLGMCQSCYGQGARAGLLEGDFLFSALTPRVPAHAFEPEGVRRTAGGGDMGAQGFCKPSSRSA
jgi:hypothetical protein